MILGITAQQMTLAPAPSGSRWWRARFPVTNSGNSTGNSGDAYIDLCTVRMFTTIGGANLIPSATDYACVPGNIQPYVADLAIDDLSLHWNNGGIQQLSQDCWVAFLLPTTDPIDRVQIRNYTTPAFSPFVVVVESSDNGYDWTFEYGYWGVPGGGFADRTFDRITSIDWSSFTSQDWLMACFKSSGYSNLGILEMEMASTIGGSNLCTGGTPRSTNNSTYPASNLTDGNIGTLCGSDGQAKRAYVGYSFASAVKVDEVRFLAQNQNEDFDWGALCAPIPGGSYVPGSFSADNGWYIKEFVNGMHDWTTFTGAEDRNHDLRNPRTLPVGYAGAHRFWRIRPTADNFLNDCSLAATQIDWKASGSSLVGAGTPLGANWFGSGYEPSLAYDGNSGTFWHSDAATVRTWIGYDFGSDVLPDEFVWTTRNDGTYHAQKPRQFVIEWSDDQSNWYLKKAFAATTPTAGNTPYSYGL